MNLLAVINEGSSVTLNAKTGKSGSFARAIAFASRDERMKMGQQMYAHWLENGQYRPFVNDVLDVLVPKTARPWVTATVPTNGPVSKDALIALCVTVDNYIVTAGKELKGQKLYIHGIVSRIVAANRSEVIEA